MASATRPSPAAPSGPRSRLPAPSAPPPSRPWRGRAAPRAPASGFPGSTRRASRRPVRTCRSSDRVEGDRKSTRLNSSHLVISYAVFCLKKKHKLRWASSLNSILSPLPPLSPFPHKQFHIHRTARVPNLLLLASPARLHLLVFTFCLAHA